MAQKFNIGDKVLVPVSKLKANLDAPSSFKKGEVIELVKRSILVDFGKEQHIQIASSLCHRDNELGFLILTLGDFSTETSLLDPLAKSILQFVRMLVPDDHIRQEKVRSLEEIEALWSGNHKAYSHVILVGHGSKNSVTLATGEVGVDEFMNTFDVEGVSKKTFISLCCQTGLKSFGGKASIHKCCKRFIAPYGSVHGAIASWFLQTFLIEHLLNGARPKISFDRAMGHETNGKFKFWENDKLPKHNPN